MTYKYIEDAIMFCIEQVRFELYHNEPKAMGYAREKLIEVSEYLSDAWRNVPVDNDLPFDID